MVIGNFLTAQRHRDPLIGIHFRTLKVSAKTPLQAIDSKEIASRMMTNDIRDKCPKCNGTGKIATQKIDGFPKFGSDDALVFLVPGEPVRCYLCEGSGKSVWNMPLRPTRRLT